MARLGALAQKNYTAYRRLKAQGVKGITKKEYAMYKKWSPDADSCLASAPSPSPSPFPSPALKRKHSEAEKPKDQKTKTDFERKWDGEPYQKFNPLDYIRKIQEIAENAPKIPERVLRAPNTSTLESEENTNGKEQNDGQRAA